MKKLILLLSILSICSLASQNAMAETDLGLHGIGAQVGIVSPEDMDATAGLGAMANHGMLADNVRLVSHLDFWSKTEDGTGGAQASVRDVALGARCEYTFATSSTRFMPFAGAGLGMHFLNAKVESPGFPDVEEGSTKLGFDFGGGFSMPVNGRTDFRSEGWYGIVDSSTQLSVKAGFMFKVGN